MNNIGEKTAKFLHKLGIRKFKDFLFHCPTNIKPLKKFPKIQDITHNDKIIIKFQLKSFDQIPKYKIIRKKPFKIYGTYNNFAVEIVYFNFYPQYIIQKLQIGQYYTIIGKADKLLGKIQITHPDLFVNILPENDIPNAEVIYPLTAGIVNKQISNYICKTLTHIPDSDWLDQDFLNQKKWLNFKDSLVAIHNANDISEIETSSNYRMRLAYDEFLAHQIAINIMRKKRSLQHGTQFQFNGSLANEILAKLNFKLTEGQKLAIKDISNDQLSPYQMSRLIQGDVGSGKTLVAICAMLNVIESGSEKTCCFMAPTDILANQHYEFIKNNLSESNIKVCLLTGKIKGKARNKVLEDLSKGQIHILIGTHAVFQENVTFKDLGLVIIDEQHRFGVEQRIKLLEKGNNPDLIVMTATPIPRTLTMTLYGDMDITRIMDKPAGRIPIQTSILSTKNMSSILASIDARINSDDRIYWICPLVELQEDQNTNEYSAAEARYQELEKLFPNCVGLIHGKMKKNEKETGLDDFATGKTKILVATTVIEVGINVPEANIIIIEHAEKFGLAQLHQLRGRVGRGSKPSFCILIYSNQISKNGMERLKILRSTNDGFILADEDLKIRGSGDIAGTKQSGLPNFKFADFHDHQSLLIQANNQAKQYLQSDPNLSSQKGNLLQELLKLYDYDEKYFMN